LPCAVEKVQIRKLSPGPGASVMVFLSLDRRANWIGSGVLLVFLWVSGSLAGEKPPDARTPGPWNLELLRQPPKVSVLEEGKSLTTLYYDGEPYRGKLTRVFAFL